MTDSARDTDVSNADDRVPGKTDALGLGERLRSARKARAMSLEWVAESLHLDETSVVALEEEHFETLGAPVFVRGHLKAYARLVGLPPDSVVEGYHASDPTSLQMPTVQRSVDRSVTINPVMWGFCGLLILLGLILAWYVAQDDAAPDPPTVAVPASIPGSNSASTIPARDPRVGRVVKPVEVSEPASVTAPAAEESTAATTGSLVDAPRVDDSSVDSSGVDVPGVESRQAVAAQSVEAGPANVQPATDLMRLSLHFREESWVEISDANRRLLFGLQREGRRRELAGEPPFRLLFGNAAGVDLRVDDEPYPVPRSGRTGQVARFEIRAEF